MSFLCINMTSITKMTKPPLCGMNTLISGVSLEKKPFTSLCLFIPWGLGTIFYVCKIYISGHIAKIAIFQNEVGQPQIFFNFLTISYLLSNIHFLFHERIKIRWDKAFWNLIPKKVNFCWWNRAQLLLLHDIFFEKQKMF